MDELVYLLALVRVDGLGPQRIQRLYTALGSATAIWHARGPELAQLGLSWSLIAALQQQRTHDDPWQAYTNIVERGIQIIAWYDERYPMLLRHVPLPPTILFVRGQLSTLQHPCVALVGTRHPSAYGADVTRRLAGDLAARGVGIVSGLALGIDTIAHQTAILHEGGSIAVLPSGVDLIYPERNATLAQHIIAHPRGALVSEFYPGTKAMPALFPARNRIISGLAQGVVVCEAGEQSGALITAKAALDQGRELMAVPGSIFVPQSAGCLQLLRQGATPVRHAEDVCESIGYHATVLASPAHDPLLQLLHSPRHIDEICRITQRTPADILGDLMMRELRGEISDLGNGYFVRLHA